MEALPFYPAPVLTVAGIVGGAFLFAYGGCLGQAVVSLTTLAVMALLTIKELDRLATWWPSNR